MAATTNSSWLYRQLFTNWKPFEVTYVTALLLLQVIAYVIAPDTVIGMISGVAGAICLVYGMKGRKISFNTENWSLWIFVNIANFCYWSILTFQTLTGDNTIGSLGANLSQVALQAALLFNAVYATKVWSSGEADNEGGTE